MTGSGGTTPHGATWGPGRWERGHVPLSPTVLLRRRWRALLLGVTVGLVAALGYVVVTEPTYRSTASVLVTPAQSASPDALLGNQGSGDEISLDTEAQLVTSTGTVRLAAEALSGQVAADDLIPSVTIEVPPNTSVLQITFSAGTPTVARDGAQAFALAYLASRGQTAQDSVNAAIEALEKQAADLQTRLETASARVSSAQDGSVDEAIAQSDVSVLTDQLSSVTQTVSDLRSNAVTPGRIIVDAQLPTNAVGPADALVLAAGLVLGLAAGLVLAVTRRHTDRRIHDVEDVERIVDLPVSSLAQGRRSRVLADLEPTTTAGGREFRRLRNALVAALPPDRRVIVVTSAGFGSDAAVAAGNLAGALARSGDPTTLICADPDFAPLRSVVPDDDEAGLSEVLAGKRQLDDVAHSVPGLPRLRVVRPGRDPGRLTTRIEEDGVEQVVETLRRTTEFVVILAPPTRTSSDAQSLARMAHAAVITVEAGHTDADDLLDAVAQLEQVRLLEVAVLLVPSQRRANQSPVASRSTVPDADVPPEPSEPRPGSTKSQVTAGEPDPTAVSRR